MYYDNVPSIVELTTTQMKRTGSSNTVMNHVHQQRFWLVVALIVLPVSTGRAGDLNVNLFCISECNTCPTICTSPPQANQIDIPQPPPPQTDDVQPPPPPPTANFQQPPPSLPSPPSPQGSYNSSSAAPPSQSYSPPPAPPSAGGKGGSSNPYYYFYTSDSKLSRFIPYMPLYFVLMPLIMQLF